MWRRQPYSLLGSGASNIVAQWSRRGIIKSIQRNTITIATALSNTATITSVDINNSVLHWLGASSDDAGATTNVATTRVALTNATTVTAFCGLASGNQIVSFEVIEFYPGFIKSVQRGTVVSGTPATITSVDTTKAILDYLGGVASGTTVNSENHARVVLTNSTTVTATEVTGTFVTNGYQVVEFF